MEQDQSAHFNMTRNKHEKGTLAFCDLDDYYKNISLYGHLTDQEAYAEFITYEDNDLYSIEDVEITTGYARYIHQDNDEGSIGYFLFCRKNRGSFPVTNIIVK